MFSILEHTSHIPFRFSTVYCVFLCHENYILIVSFKLKVAHTEAKKLRLKCHDSICFKQEKLLLVKSVITHTLQ